MKNKQLLFAFFGLMVIAQLFVPASMIFQNTKVLQNGEEFHFRLQPIDPTDPFRGEYIILNFLDDGYVSVDSSEMWEGHHTAYAIIENNADGYAYVADVQQEAPLDISNYLALPIEATYENSIHFNFPFDRFYMSEDKAQKAEDLYFENLRDSTSINYAVVSINNGKAVLKDVQVNGISLVDLVGEE